ncbi:MAG: hypothetical protein LBC20_02900, partial [Planctomycetaceae bacterium]|nr:hypothetical protein [Planctomycetaceae bacterium]
LHQNNTTRKKLVTQKKIQINIKKCVDTFGPITDNNGNALPTNVSKGYKGPPLPTTKRNLGDIYFLP